METLILKIQVYSVSDKNNSDSEYLSEKRRMADAVRLAKCMNMKKPGQADVMFNLGAALQAMAQLVLK